MLTSWKIRPAVTTDAPEMYAVFAESIRDLTQKEYTREQQVAWIKSGSPEYFGSLVALEQHDVWVAEGNDKRILGFAALHYDDLSYLYIHPKWAKQGLGSKMLATAIAAARRRGVGQLTLRSSLTARTFYVKYGFTVVCRMDINRSGIEIPSILMVKDL